MWIMPRLISPVTRMSASVSSCVAITDGTGRPPSPMWAGGAPLARDWRVAALVALLTVAAGVAFFNDGLRDFFMLTRLGPVDIVVVLVATAAWAYGIREIWRRRLVARLLGLDRGRINRA